MVETLEPSAESPQFEQEREGKISDPRAYIVEFESSNFYQDALGKYKHENPGVPEGEILKDFRDLPGSKKYIDGLWKFFTSQKGLIYDEKQYSPDTKIALNQYWQTIKEWLQREKLGRLDKDRIEDIDFKRGIYHGRAAAELVTEGIAPNQSVGRTLVHFLSIDQGLDKIDPGREERRARFSPN